MNRLPPIIILTVLACESLALAVLMIHDAWGEPDLRQTPAENAQLAKTLMLTDLALWTEARYTRHPSQADCFTPFQNGPATPDQFPSATWVAPIRQGSPASTQSWLGR